MRVDRIIAGWYAREPWPDLSPDEVSALIYQRAIALIETRGRAMPGALEAVAFFQERAIPIGIASSSPCMVIEANIAALGIQDALATVHSAVDETHGKPHPAVYLTAAAKLGVPPQQCLVFEDAIPGVLAAKAAEMTCICVPDAAMARDKRLGIADYVLPSLRFFDERLWQVVNGS